MGLYRTGVVVAVLSALDVRQWRYVAQVAALTGVGDTTVSKALIRLDGAGLVESRWEEPEEARDGAADGSDRQRRHYYRLTATGLAQALRWGGGEPGGSEKLEG